MKEINLQGIIAGACTWLALMYIMTGRISCLSQDACEPSDFFLVGVIAVGLVVPSALVALVLSFPGKRKSTSNS